MRRDAVDVLLGRDGLERGALVDVRPHRVLEQDAVHGRVLGEGGDGLDQFGGGDRGGQGDVP